MTMDQINTRLEELREEKTKIQGLETEVYARIVGYYRSVRNWNKGKKAEYSKRLNYGEIEMDRPSALSAVSAAPAAVETDAEQPSVFSLVKEDDQQELAFAASASSVPSSYLYFFRKTCPNCPPVAGWLKTSGLEGRAIDVDRESGMHEAQRYDVTAAPTVVLLNDAGEELGRGSTVAALESQAPLDVAAGA